MDNTELESKLELVKILDKLIEEGVWQGTPFMESAGKKLQVLREALSKEFNLNEPVVSKEPNMQQRVIAPAAERVEVYLSLYQAEGLNIKKWESLLNVLSNYSTGRPIYVNEEDMEASLRAKENKTNDAYVAIYVQKNDINPTLDKPLVDRFNHPLLSIRDGALKPQNITKFVHSTGVYTFVHGMLAKKKDL